MKNRQTLIWLFAIAAFLIIAAIGLDAFAQEPPSPPPPAAEEATTGAVIDAGAKLISSDWEKLGALGSLLAIVNFLMILTKLGALGRWLKDKGLKWVRPLAATLLAGALGALSSLETGLPVMQSLLAGLLAGVGSIGFHELKDTMTKSGREKRAT